MATAAPLSAAYMATACERSLVDVLRLDCTLTTVRLPSVASADMTIRASSSELPRWRSRVTHVVLIPASYCTGFFLGLESPSIPRIYTPVTWSRGLALGTRLAQRSAMRHFLLIALVSVGCVGTSPTTG